MKYKKYDKKKKMLTSVYNTYINNKNKNKD